MTTQWETVHIFISSTFNDMHAERDYLVKQVFPQLSEWCEKRKLRLVDIDLRWGVTEADAQNQSVVRVCLDRIDDCRPFFLCFLGQRRGWVPGEGDISPETFKEFPALKEHAGKASVTEMEILHALVDPLHRGTVRDALKPGEFYEPVKYAFFYLREDTYLNQVPTDPPQLRQTYTNEGIEDPVERAAQEGQLKHWRSEKIPAAGRPAKNYLARWDPSLTTPELLLPTKCPSSNENAIQHWQKQWKLAGVNISGLDLEADASQAAKAQAFNEKLSRGRLAHFLVGDQPLSQVILADLQSAISNRYPEHGEVVGETELQKELDQQEQFLFTGSEGFIEREGDFDELDTYAEGESNQPFLLTAAGGMGKSSLLARWVNRYRTKLEGRSEASIHFRFIGQSDRSTTVHALLGLLFREIKEITGKLEETIPDDPQKLIRELPALLEAIGKRGRTVIVLDALNQLESGLSNLAWLPYRLPENIKLIFSFKRGEETAEELLKQLQGQVILSEVRPFATLEHRRQLVNKYLEQYLKQLDEKLLEALIHLPGADNPLYLKVVLSELRVFGAFANLGEKIRSDFGETPQAAFKAVLRRLENDPAYAQLDPRKAVPLLFGLLAHARQGLSVDELSELFVQVKGVDKQAARDTIHLYLRQVRPFLAHRDGRYDFFFESFRLAALEKYATDERPGREWHQQLAEYFGRQPLFIRTGAVELPNLRKLLELPFQQVHAGMESDLLKTLTDYPFLENKVRAFNTQELIEDYDLAVSDKTPAGEKTSPTARQGLRLIQGALRLSASALTLDSHQLAGQLHGRLLDSENEIVQSLLKQASRKTDKLWLCPLTNSLSAPGGPLLQTLSGHSLWVQAVAISPDCSRVVSAGSDKKVKVWNRESGQLIHTLSDHTDGIMQAAITSDGRQLVTGSRDKTIRIWDLESGRQMRVLSVNREVWAMALASDDQVVLFMDNQSIYGIDINSGTLLYRVDEKGNDSYSSLVVYALAVSQDGETALSGSASSYSAVIQWDLKKKKQTRVLKGHRGKIRAVAISPDGKTALSGSEDDTIILWDLQRGSVIRTFTGHTGDVTCVAYFPDGSKFASGSGDKTIRVWNIHSGQVISILTGHAGDVNALAISQDGRLAVSGGDDNAVKVWDLAAGQPASSGLTHADTILSVAVSSDGNMAASGSKDGTIRVWEGKNGRELAKIQVGAWTNAVSFSHDNRKILSGGMGAKLRAWDVQTGRELFSLAGHSDMIESLLLTRDGRKAITGSGDEDGSVIIWDLESHTQLHSLHWITGSIKALALSPDDRLLVTGADFGVSDTFAETMKSRPRYRDVCIWDMESGKVLHYLPEWNGYVKALQVTADGKKLFLAGGENIQLRDIVTGALINTLAGHTGIITSLAISPDGRLLVSTSFDHSLRVWDVETADQLASFQDEGDLYCCTCSPDGKWLFAGGNSNRPHLLKIIFPGQADEAPPLDAGELEKLGKSCLDSGKYQEALAYFSSALALKPDDLNLLFYRATTLTRGGRNEEAILQLDHIIDHNLAPGANLGYAYVGKANALVNLKRYEESLEWYRKATEIVSNVRSFWFMQGYALYCLPKFDLALESLQKAETMSPEEKTREFIGWCQLGVKKYEEAWDTFGKLTASPPRDVLSWYGMGLAAKALGKKEQAREYLGKFLEQAKPEHAVHLPKAKEILAGLG